MTGGPGTTEHLKYRSLHWLTCPNEYAFKLLEQDRLLLPQSTGLTELPGLSGSGSKMISQLLLLKKVCISSQTKLRSKSPTQLVGVEVS